MAKGKGTIVRPTRALWLGRRRYAPTLELQRALQTARREDAIDDLVLLVEHEPVITLGRSADESNLLIDEALLKARGVDVARIGRGGDVTYHGPGQLVGYPIINLKPDRCDVRHYVRALAEVMILIAREHGIEAGVVDKMIGVWVDAAAPDCWAGEAWSDNMVKIGAIGVRITQWVTMHGFALNLTTDLDAFSMIVPCGIRDYGVASVAKLASRAAGELSVADVALCAGPLLARALDLEVAEVEDRAAEVDLQSLLLP